MKLTLPLDKMTTEEKLLALEEIWEDLCRTPDNIPSPAWHVGVLEERPSSLSRRAKGPRAQATGRGSIYRKTFRVTDWHKNCL